MIMKPFDSSFIEDLNKADTGIKLEAYCFEDDPSKLVIALDGHLDTANSPKFSETAVALLISSSQVKTAVFDFKKLTYVSSTGIGAFTTILIHTKQNNIDMLICNMGSKIKSVLDTLGLTSSFNITDTIEDSFKSDKSEEKPEFPFTVTCTSCKKTLKVKKPGVFRCPSCGSVIKVDENGK